MENENVFITGNVAHKKNNFILFFSQNKLVSASELPESFFDLKEEAFNHIELAKKQIDSYMITEIEDFYFGGFFGKPQSNLPKILKMEYYDLNHNKIEPPEDLKNNLKIYVFTFPK